MWEPGEDDKVNHFNGLLNFSKREKNSKSKASGDRNEGRELLRGKAMPTRGPWASPGQDHPMAADVESAFAHTRQQNTAINQFSLYTRAMKAKEKRARLDKVRTNSTLCPKTDLDAEKILPQFPHFLPHRPQPGWPSPSLLAQLP